jgi:HK97 family phage major capsid protein
MTTAAASAGAVVPTITVNKVIEKVGQYCPMLDKIELLRVPGGVKIPAEGTTVEAQLHAEGATITADSDTVTAVQLAAYEITKLVTISKSVERMSIDAFEEWLTRKIAREIAKKISKLIFLGTGTNEPQGINAITWSATNSVTVAVNGSLTAANVKALVGLLNGEYDDGAEWYMKKTTFFNDFHPLMDNSKDNLVTYDPASGKYYVMGYPVNWDDRLTLHEAFLGNALRGYVGNLPEDVTITSEFVVRENSFDFLGCAMFDGKVQATEAFVKLIKATS